MEQVPIKKSALIYLKEELNFKVSEFQKLSQEDKDTLRRWAEAEMTYMHIYGW